MRDVRDLLLFVLAALVPDLAAEDVLLFIELFFDVDRAAAAFFLDLAGDAFFFVLVVETLFLLVALLFAVGFFFDFVPLFAVFFA